MKTVYLIMKNGNEARFLEQEGEVESKRGCNSKFQNNLKSIT